ncbi:MAG: ABC transporter permease subunit [Planctomycetota bacterium]
MRRALVIVAALVFVALSVAPVVAMALRIEGDDLAALADARIWSLIRRTFVLGVAVSAGCLAVGVPFGFLVARTNMPGARLLRPLAVVPILMPTLLMAMTWTALVPLRGAVATGLLLVLSYFPLVAIFAARAAERIDRRQEESAWSLGGLRAALRADLGAILPPALAGACLAFTFAVNDFSIPDFVSSIGPKFNVYADEIFANWNQYERPGLAVASSLPLLAMTCLALVPMLALRRRGAFAPLASSFQRPGTLPLGRWRWPAALACTALVGASVIVPVGRLLWESTGGPTAWRPEAVRLALVDPEAPPPPVASRPTPMAPIPESTEPPLSFDERVSALPVIAGRQLTTMRKGFTSAFQRAREDLVRSLELGAMAAFLTALLGLVLGHAAERGRARSAVLLAALVPIAVPGVLFGIGTQALWDSPWLAEVTGGASTRFYTTPTMAGLLFTGRFAAFGILIVSGAVASAPLVAEQAAASVGAGPLARLFRIVLPQVVGALVATWICVFAFALRELDSALIVTEARRTAIVRVFNGVHFGRDEYVASLALLLVFTILLPGILWSAFAPRPAEVLP